MVEYQEIPSVFIGVDVGKSTHHAVALDRDGNILVDRKLPNDEHALRDVIAELRPMGSMLLVVDQASDVGSLPVAVARDEGVLVSYLPGLAMRRIADLHVGHAKSDARDALVIAQAARTLPHTLRPLSSELESIAELRLLGTYDELLATQAAATSNRIRAFLTRVHPALERVLGPRLRHPAVVALLVHYPSPEALRRAGHAAIEADLVGGAPRIGRELANDICLALDCQSVVVPGGAAGQLVLLGLARQLEMLRDERDMVSSHIERLVEAHPKYPLLASMPGVGVSTCARILTEVVGREFLSAGHLASFAGLAPVTRRSGTSINRDRRSRQGNHSLKRALVTSAFAAISHDPKSRAYYDRKIREGKRHREALLALTRRRLDVLFAMLRDERPYNEAPAVRGATEPPPLRRVHRARRRVPAPSVPPPIELEQIAAHLAQTGSFHTRVDRLPTELAPLRRALREVASGAGLRIQTVVKNGYFVVDVPGFEVSEESLDAVFKLMNRGIKWPRQSTHLKSD